MPISQKYHMLTDLRINNPNMSLNAMAIEVSTILGEPPLSRERIRQLLNKLNLPTQSTDWAAKRIHNRPMPMPKCEKCRKTITFIVKSFHTHTGYFMFTCTPLLFVAPCDDHLFCAARSATVAVSAKTAHM